MRGRRVGANVSPMQGMLSLALVLIKPALLSYPASTARPYRSKATAVKPNQQA
jgi:hypothetical protein